MINPKMWNEFRVDEIFEFERGDRLITQNHVSGNIAYISSTKKNNGIDNYILPPDFMKIHRNKLTISNSGSIGYCFYHEYDFVASDHVSVIGIKDNSIVLNRKIAMFLKVIFEALRPKYNFGREISNTRLSKEIVALPADEHGNPDWNEMQRMIKEQSKTISYNKKDSIENYYKKKKTIDLDLDIWREFKYEDIFDIKKGKRLTKENMEQGVTPFIGAIDNNNGVRQFVDAPAMHTDNTITVNYNGSVGEAFYQPFSFYASDDVNILYLKFPLNKYIAMFLITLIKQEKFRYNYGRKWHKERMDNSTIKLPIDEKGEPNWIFMENYIKSLPYSEYI